MSEDTKQNAGGHDIETSTAVSLSHSQKIDLVTGVAASVSSSANLSAPVGKVVTVRSSYNDTLSIPFNVPREERKLLNLQGNRPDKTQTKTTAD